MTDTLTEAAPEPQSQADQPASRPPPTSATEPTRESAPAPQTERRGGVWMIVLLALVALVAAGYSLYRLDVIRDRIDALRADVAATATTQAALRADFDAFVSRDADARRTTATELDTLRPLPKRIDDVVDAVAELKDRADLPERTVARTEVRFLLGEAQRRLALDGDFAAATASLEAADARLDALSDPAFAGVRDAIASELAALRAVPQPDRTALISQLAQAEQSTDTLPLRGRVVGESEPDESSTLPQNGLERAWAIVRNAFSNLITVRRTNSPTALLTREAAQLTRQRLAMLLFSARLAVLRGDGASYEVSLRQARAALENDFDGSDAAVTRLGQQLDALGQVDIDPPRPDISQSLRALNQIPVASGKSG